MHLLTPHLPQHKHFLHAIACSDDSDTNAYRKSLGFEMREKSISNHRYLIAVTISLYGTFHILTFGTYTKQHKYYFHFRMFR